MKDEHTQGKGKKRNIQITIKELGGLQKIQVNPQFEFTKSYKEIFNDNKILITEQ